jgi:uncharacterized protein (TIGR01370 family)
MPFRAQEERLLSILPLIVATSGVCHGLYAAAPPVEPQPPTVALFYGRPLPVAALSRFDWVVLEPRNATTSDREALRKAGVRIFAYLSVGEVSAGEPVDRRWVLGRDERWTTLVMDPADRGWRELLLAHAAALERDGYNGLFLDTLDSYAKVLRSPEARRMRIEALVDLCRTLRARHPALALFFNRGFEILDQAGELASAVAAESVFFGWDQTSRNYVDVEEADRAWLVERLQALKARLGIPVVALDYLPPSRSAEARAAARRLEELGLIPWISTPELDQIGLGTSSASRRLRVDAQEHAQPTAVPRLLLLHDAAESFALEHSLIARLVAPHAQALGFEVDLFDVRAGLPPDARAAGYTGIVSWFTDDELPYALDYPGWLLRQMTAGTRVVILGRPGFPASATFLEALGLAATSSAPARLVRIAQRDELIGFEAEPRLRARDLLRWEARSPELRVHLRIEDEHGASVDPVLTAPWGGLALQPYLIESGYAGRIRWIVDPGAFLMSALAAAAKAD